MDLKHSIKTWRIQKNVFVIGTAFMIHFTAFNGAANLQSSINISDGLGTMSLAAVYAGLILSNLFLPSMIIKWIGHKWAISTSFIVYMPYIVAQFWPSFYTLVPAGFILGIGGGPLWCGKCTYFSIMSEAQSGISGEPSDVVLARFFGYFFMMFQLNQVWGNLISSLVLSTGNKNAATSINASLIPELCGAHFLPNEQGSALNSQPIAKIQLMSGVFLACMVAASVLVAVAVDSTKRYNVKVNNSATGASPFQLFAETVKLMREPNQILLFVILIYIGLEQAFMGSDFTAAFVSCAIGTGSVGFVMMTSGITNAVSCALIGYIVKITGRVPLIIAGFCTHLGMYLTFVLWQPQSDQKAVLYAIAAVAGIADSAWMVNVNVFCGVIFPGREVAAFANFRLWESVGWFIAYVYSPYLRLKVKTYILIGVMSLGVFCYLVVEYRHHKALRRKQNEKTNEGYDNMATQL